MTRTRSEAHADNFDALLVPGGVMNPDPLRTIPEAVAVVRAFFEAGKPVAAISHGPQLLIEADVVHGEPLSSRLGRLVANTLPLGKATASVAGTAGLVLPHPTVVSASPMTDPASRPLTLPLKTFLGTSLLTGTLDGSSAVIYQFIVVKAAAKPGVPHPERIFQYIASAVFGPPALQNPAYAWLGVLFHYLIAFCVTGTFLLLFPRVRAMRWNWVVSGIIYGAAIWSVMNLLIVPHTNVPRWGVTLKGALIDSSILMGCIGLPAAFIAHRSMQAQAA